MSLGDEIIKELRQARLRALADSANEAGKKAAQKKLEELELMPVMLALKELSTHFRKENGIKFIDYDSSVLFRLSSNRRIYEVDVSVYHHNITSGQGVFSVSVREDYVETPQLAHMSFDRGQEGNLVRAIMAVIALFETKGYLTSLEVEPIMRRFGEERPD